MKIITDFGVRALFGTLIIGGFLGTTIWGMTHDPSVLTHIKDLFVPLVMAIIAFYFGQKSAK